MPPKAKTLYLYNDSEDVTFFNKRPDFRENIILSSGRRWVGYGPGPGYTDPWAPAPVKVEQTFTAPVGKEAGAACADGFRDASGLRLPKGLFKVTITPLRTPKAPAKRYEYRGANITAKRAKALLSPKKKGGAK